MFIKSADIKEFKYDENLSSIVCVKP